MELGGKSAAIVHADADIEQVIDSVKVGIYFNAGQVCSAMSRLLVHRSRFDEVVERVRRTSERLSIGPGTRWEDVPDDWLCPDCGVGKEDFEMLEISDIA